MKLCLLYLSVLTLLQLHSRYVASAGEIIWLPTIEKLASIIHICEHEKFYEEIPVDEHEIRSTRRSPVYPPYRSVNTNVNDQSMTNNNWGIVSARTGKRNSLPPINVNVKERRRPSPISNVVSINNANTQGEQVAPRTVGINVGHKAVKNLNNVQDESVSWNSRSLSASAGIERKRKYRNVANCVNRRLLQAYKEEIAFSN